MSGVGSSSAFTVGLLHSLYALKGEFVTKRKLAIEAINVEQNLIGEAVGSQDQVAAAFGGLNIREFMKDGRIIVNPVTIHQNRFKELEKSLLLFFTGISRTASEIAKTQINELKNKSKELNLMKEMVDEAVDILYSKNRNLDEFGNLLNESWQIKRNITDKISSAFIDSIYNRGIKAGAIGGKLLGAGGGGFMLSCSTEKQDSVIQELSIFTCSIPFRSNGISHRTLFFIKEQI